MNEFTANDISVVTPAALTAYDVAILGEMALTDGQVTMLSDWVNAGGHLIAMRPDKKLAGLLGLTDASIDARQRLPPVQDLLGTGLGTRGPDDPVPRHRRPLQPERRGEPCNALFHFIDHDHESRGHAEECGNERWPCRGLCLRPCPFRGVYPAGESCLVRTGAGRRYLGVIRSDDLFYGNASFDHQPDWIDLNKVAIPQADEQQRLLANLIITMNSDKKPLPRFWYLPRGLAAAVVMSGDDHDGNGTAGRFDTQLALSPSGCSVDNWECIRSTSYIFPDNALTNSQASVYVSAGFEIGTHISTNCANWTPFSLDMFYSTQLDDWAVKYSAVPLPVSCRVHCIAWSDYATMPAVELGHGIRLDTNYYYWPPTWVDDRPGFFTGSGIPMRFTDINGNLIDVYQATTQLTDESGQTYPYSIDTLLDKALGPEGYYGVFTANAHTDVAETVESDAIVNSAKARGIPVVSARQMLAWLDGRGASTFTSLSWNGSTLDFSVTAGSGANGLTAMAPVPVNQTVAGVTRNNSAVAYSVKTVKGIPYVFFGAETGSYQVSFASDVAPPTVLGVHPLQGAAGVSASTSVTASFSEDMDPATITATTVQLRSPQNTAVASIVQYDAAAKTATLSPSASLDAGALYTAVVKGGTDGAKDRAGNPLSSDYTWTFTTTAAPAGPYTIWSSMAAPASAAVSDGVPLTVGVKFRSDVNGYITGLRFYKGSANTGTHVGSLWTRTGTLLATATFAGETSSGWQQVLFSSPVAVTANTTYVASYYSPSGYFALTSRYFSAAVDNAPLHALADGTDGGNGVYYYGNGFPTQTWSTNNYWVDVVFQP